MLNFMDKSKIILPPLPELNETAITHAAGGIKNAIDLIKTCNNIKSISMGGFTISEDVEFINGQWVSKNKQTIIDHTIKIEYH